MTPPGEAPMPLLQGRQGAGLLSVGCSLLRRKMCAALLATVDTPPWTPRPYAAPHIACGYTRVCCVCVLALGLRCHTVTATPKESALVATFGKWRPLRRIAQTGHWQCSGMRARSDRPLWRDGGPNYPKRRTQSLNPSYQIIIFHFSVVQRRPIRSQSEVQNFSVRPLFSCSYPTSRSPGWIPPRQTSRPEPASPSTRSKLSQVIVRGLLAGRAPVAQSLISCRVHRPRVWQVSPRRR